MIQPVAKLRFVERYCSPSEGWSVFVDRCAPLPESAGRRDEDTDLSQTTATPAAARCVLFFFVARPRAERPSLPSW